MTCLRYNNRLLSLFTAVLTALSLLFSSIAISPVYANELQRQERNSITLSDAEAQQVIEELEQQGFSRTVLGDNGVHKVILTKDGGSITLTKLNGAASAQSRNSTDRWVIGTPGVFYGDDAWGFYIKLEWPAQAALFGATSLGVGFAVKAAIRIAYGVILRWWERAIVNTVVKTSLNEAPPLEVLMDSLSLCPPFQPRYIRFDPFRTKCN